MSKFRTIPLISAVTIPMMTCAAFLAAVKAESFDDPQSPSRHEIVATIGVLNVDTNSEAGNRPLLILENRACLLSDANDLLEQMSRQLKADGHTLNQTVVVIRADREIATESIQTFIGNCQSVGFEQFALKVTRQARVGVDDSPTRVMPAIRIRLRSHPDGSLASLHLGRRQVGASNASIDKLPESLATMFELWGVDAVADGFEVEINADSALDFEHVSRTLKACTEVVDRNQQRYVSRVKFAPPAK